MRKAPRVQVVVLGEGSCARMPLLVKIDHKSNHPMASAGERLFVIMAFLKMTLRKDDVDVDGAFDDGFGQLW